MTKWESLVTSVSVISRQHVVFLQRDSTHIREKARYLNYRTANQQKICLNWRRIGNFLSKLFFISTFQNAVVSLSFRVNNGTVCSPLGAPCTPYPALRRSHLVSSFAPDLGAGSLAAHTYRARSRRVPETTPLHVPPPAGVPRKASRIHSPLPLSSCPAPSSPPSWHWPAIRGFMGE